MTTDTIAGSHGEPAAVVRLYDTYLADLHRTDLWAYTFLLLDGTGTFTIYTDQPSTYTAGTDYLLTLTPAAGHPPGGPS